MTTTHVPWLLVFVKAPTPGRVKTRLLSILTAEEAAQLYRCLVVDTLDVVRPLSDLRVVVAYAAHPDFPDLRWLAYRGPMVFQQGRALGDRLVHAFQWAFEQGAPSVIALGSDAPHLSGAWIQSACDGLQHVDVVIGPTVDGGYHLIGLTAPRPELFTDIPWSTPQVLRRTLHRLQQLQLGVRCLTPVGDLDTPEDLLRYVASPSVHQARSHTAAFLRQRATTLMTAAPAAPVEPHPAKAGWHPDPTPRRGRPCTTTGAGPCTPRGAWHPAHSFDEATRAPSDINDVKGPDGGVA